MKIENWKLKIKTKKAFTLAELLVVIAFISIMSGVVLTSYSTNKNKKAVETEARKVAAAIREAQNYALTGKGAGVACTFSYSGSTYSIGGCVAVSYSLPSGVTFKNNTGSPITFKAVWGTVSGGPTATATVKKGSYCVDVTVNAAGNVTEGAVGGCS